jgi:putative cofactor-binding repeat protein
VDIFGVTIQNGDAGNTPGGGILNAGMLTLTDSTVSGNTVDVSDGGGISSYCSPEWEDSCVKRPFTRETLHALTESWKYTNTPQCS